MLKVSHLVKEYQTAHGKKRVLDDLSFEVSKAEIVGITGKSGAGKTTLLKILRGVESFDKGEIEINGEKIYPDSGKEGEKILRQATAIHLQRNFGLWSGPAIENIIRRLNFHLVGTEALPLPEHHTYQELYDEALSILKTVHLEDKALHSTDQLSGGEKQRLVLARQIAARPKFLLLDEPVTMTGPDTKQEILDVILELKEKLEIPILVVSHLPEVHAYIADRVLFLENGKIAMEGDPVTVLKSFLKDMEPKESLLDVSERKPCIRAKDVSKRYSLIRVGEVLNIQNLNFDIYEKQITTFIGSSGAGKTTVMKLLEGMVPPTSGTIEILYREHERGTRSSTNDEKDNKNADNDGKWIDIGAYNENRIYLRSVMSIMNQEFSMSVNSTVRDQIRFRLSMKTRYAVDAAKDRAADFGIPPQVLDIIYRLPDMTTEEKDTVMSELGIPEDIFSQLFPVVPSADVDKYAAPIFKALDLPLEILDQKPDQISGGEHVRAFIALSLVTSPDYLFLDEPFGDLDPVTLRDVTNALKRINKEFGTTIVMVSHHMDFVKEASHRAIWIDKGAIEMDGDPEKVCSELVKKSNAKYLDFDIEKLMQN
ncbi:Vitamin B12 import ATP-binding protein BtuD [Methanimicrococcus hongohii]|uniref:Vitamin B12 import ATP-binding protein BtuD n=1 Tax=Methanimicrococcus hongohii TaxID=3028295 RepID=A0AA96V0G6_9EURY|nr:ATP-binding cassette domain-containing protein [Methanimicrococcus sp. Hf6]WNY24114.1 Vitamin B12 import ATP-binding protein BtuD [Methanimicrococcus sp. Hf6]